MQLVLLESQVLLVPQVVMASLESRGLLEALVHQVEQGLQDSQEPQV